MKRGFVKSSPHFFRPVGRALLLLVVLLAALAPFIPAPLQEAADPAHTPNPVKAAWFLLWIQELVSHSRLMIYPVLAGALFFLFLPWLPGQLRVNRATWFPRELRWINLATVTVFVAIVVLTVVALYFRGENWSLSFPG
ncbi:cytochrome B6 [Geomonas sp. Red32]|uniref:selenite/tellurite reduction operon b-type cytochrome membrane protein ExtQ n=1 Tax=Geomonas sp. Red32 TaxID=2912856 RepID=UPI00202CD15F|nr:selenite/tellurite reduction operon b-type cytochrome membrane protein ExtQ [Geomonas sp. Red32]MCM0082143.1 cytochrome B6 [Geomonas sp. Red32]